MTISRIYRCDLCNTMRDPQQLIGLYWRTMPTGQAEAITVRPARDVEHHVCPRCLEQLQAIAVPDVQP